MKSSSALAAGAAVAIILHPAAAAFPPGSGAAPGRAVFLKNCAHCHGADAGGGEGPDLHQLDESDSWIANRIRQGKAGEMTAFAGKLPEEDVTNVIAYLRSLK